MQNQELYSVNSRCKSTKKMVNSNKNNAEMHFFFDWDANFLLSEPKGTEEGLKNHHRHLIGFILFVLCRVPDGTLVYW